MRGLYRSVFFFLGIFLSWSVFGVSFVFAQETPPPARTGRCEYFCGNTPQASIPIREASPVGDGTRDCMEVCRANCHSACGTTTGGCFAIKCTYDSVPTERTSGPGFVRNRTTCGGKYVIDHRTDAARLQRAHTVSVSTGQPTLNELHCRPARQESDRNSRCVLGACTGSDYCCAGDEPAPPPGSAPAANDCLGRALAANTTLTDPQKTALRNTLTANGSRQLSCQRVCSAATRGDQTKCISGGCDGGDTAICCIPGIGQPATTQNANACRTTASGSGSRSGGSSSWGITLPTCTRDGNCQLSDILATGVSFANFLFGLAGALFFAIIVYGGFRYVFFAYDSGTAQKSKEMIKNAMVGLLLMMMASLFVRFVGNAVRGTDVSGESCTANNGPDFSCVDIHPQGNVSTARRQAEERGCKSNQCPGTGQNVMCCPLGWDNFTEQDSGSSSPATGGGTPPASGGAGDGGTTR